MPTMRSKTAGLPESFARTDYYLCDPRDIKVDLNENGANSRWAPSSDEFIEQLVKSFEAHGQLQPIQVKRTGDGSVRLIAGYNRLQAALRYNERHPSKPMKLQAKVLTCNDEEGFVRSILENRERQSTTPMDDAFNHRTLRERFGYKDKQIAELYGVAPSTVSNFKKLLLLPRELQHRVHTYTLPVRAALELSVLPEDDQKKIVQQSTSETTKGGKAGKGGKKGQTKTKVSTEQIMEGIRRQAQETGNLERIRPRTPQQVVKFFEKVIETTDPKDRVTDVAEVVCHFVEGLLTEEEMATKFPLAVCGTLE